jgi:hypothetical protein
MEKYKKYKKKQEKNKSLYVALVPPQKISYLVTLFITNPSKTRLVLDRFQEKPKVIFAFIACSVLMLPISMEFHQQKIKPKKLLSAC